MLRPGGGPARSGWSGGLFAASFLYPVLSDLLNLLVPVAANPTFADLQRTQPHTRFHAPSAPIAPFVILLVFAIALVGGPYRRGERWAWRVLAAAGLVSLAVKTWASFAIHMHGVFDGLEQDLWIPGGLWLLALVLSAPASTQAAPRSAVGRDG